MAIKSLNSVGGFSVKDVGTGDITIIINSNGNVSTPDLTVSGVSQLGDVANVKITGGLANYVLTTDGLGNLSWSTGGAPSTVIVAAWMPYLINTGEVYLVPDNRQGLFNLPIDIGDGTLEVEGILVEV